MNHRAYPLILGLGLAAKLCVGATAPAANPTPVAPKSPAAPAGAVAVPSSNSSAAAAKGGVVLALTPRFNQVRGRIDALFAQRNETPPPPPARANPFRPPGPVPEPTPIVVEASPSKPVAVARASSSDVDQLQKSAASLKLSGIFEIGGKSHLVINGRPYKEGDLVPTLLGGETIYLRVRNITKPNVTFALNAAELAVNFDPRPPARAGSGPERKSSGTP